MRGMARVQLNVWVDEAERAQIKALAAQRGVPVGRLVVDALLGPAQSPEAAMTGQVQQAVREAREALERVASTEETLENLDRRVRRFEEMAHGSF